MLLMVLLDFAPNVLKVTGVTLNEDNTVDVAFTVADRYQLYTSTRAVVRYENLVGDRYLEITSGPGDLVKLAPGATIPKDNTAPALDLDALLGGLRPVLKGLEGKKINEISSAVIELLQGQGGRLHRVEVPDVAPLDPCHPLLLSFAPGHPTHPALSGGGIPLL